MAVNERLNDFADISAASEQFDYLKRRIEEYVKQMDEASKMAKLAFDGLQGTSNLSDLNKGANEAAAANKKMAESVKNYAKAVADTDEFLKQYAGTMQANLRLQLQYEQRLAEIKRELKENTSVTGDYTKKVEALKQEELSLKTAMSEVRIALKQEEKERQAAIGSYDEMSVRLGRLRDTYRQLSEADRNSEAGVNIVAQINKLDEEVKKVDASIGNFQRNVGNYPNAEKELKAIREELIRLTLEGKQGTEEFENLSNKAHGLGLAINSVGSLTPLTATVVTTSQQLGKVNQQMHQLAVEGKQDTHEFKLLVEEARRLKTAMDSVKDAVGGVGDKVNGVGEKVDGLGESAGNFIKGAAAAAAAYISFDAVKSVVQDSIKEFEEADLAARQLQNTLENNGAPAAVGRINDKVEELYKSFSYLADDDIKKVFTSLIDYGKLTEAQMNELIGVIIDFSAKEQVSITDASDTIVKALEGNGKALKKYGIDIKEAGEQGFETVSTTDRLSLIMKELKPRVEGAATALGGSFQGKIASITESIKALEEQIGTWIVSLSGVEEASHQAAVAAKNEATAAQALIDEYELLSSSVNITEKDKKRLNSITTTLTANFGSSVVSIDSETGALTLNVSATKDLIKQKLLLANMDASSIALNLKAEQDRYNTALNEATKVQMAYNQAVKETGITNEQVVEKIKQQLADRTSGNFTEDEKRINKLAISLQRYKETMRGSSNEMKKLENDLKQLGFSLKDVDTLFQQSDKLLTKTDTPKRMRDDLNLQLGAIRDGINARYAFQIEQLKAESEFNRSIMDSTEYSLEARLEAYHKYYKGLEEMVNLNAKRDIENEEAKINIAKQRIEAGRSGLLKLSTIEQSALADQIEAAEFNIQAIKQRSNAQQAATEREAGKTMVSIVSTNESTILKLKETALRKQLIDIDGRMTEEERIVHEAYRKGQIGEEQHKMQLAEINDRYQEEQNRANLAFYWNLLTGTKLSNDEELKAWDGYYKALKKLNDDSNKQQIEAAKELGAAKEELRRQETQLITEGVTAAKALLDNFYDSELQKLDAKAEALQRNAQLEEETINKSLLSQEEKEKRIAGLNAQRAIQERQIEQERAKIERKKAIADRVAAIANVVQGQITAQAGALKYLSNPVTAPLYPAIAATIAGIGLAQAAAILSQPLPAYAEGTPEGGHPKDGYALVGEEYKPELIISDGKASVVDSPTIMKLSKGDRVIPQDKVMQDMENMINFLPASLLRMLLVPTGGDTGGVALSMEQLEQTLVAEGRATREAIKNKTETHFNWSNGEMIKTVRNGNNWTTYIHRQNN